MGGMSMLLPEDPAWVKKRVGQIVVSCIKTVKGVYDAFVIIDAFACGQKILAGKGYPGGSLKGPGHILQCRRQKR